MRLALIMSVHSPWARQTAQRLSAQGHEIHVIDLYHNASADSSLGGNIGAGSTDISSLFSSVREVYIGKTILKSYRAYLPFAAQIRKFCRSIQADAILTLYGGGFALSAYLSGIRPYAVYIVGSDITLIKGIRRSLTRIALEAADMVFVNGGHICNLTKSLAPKGNIFTLLLGVDTANFAPVTTNSERLKIVCSRNFAEIYNNKYIIEGLSLSNHSVGNYSVIFTSGGSTLNAVKALAQKCLSPELLAEVNFLGGVSDAELREQVRNSHIYVSMSRSDGTSTSLLEAMSCGLFPIVSDIPANREWIDPSVNNGILVPLGQPSKLAKALERALNDEPLRRKAAGFNRGLILERADRGKNSEILLAKLESMINSHKIR